MMNIERRSFSAFVIALPVLGRAAAVDPRVGLVLEYWATHQTRVKELWFDEIQYLGIRGSVMSLMPPGNKREFLSGPLEDIVPAIVRGAWSYRSTLHAGANQGQWSKEGVQENDWREASAEAPLRAQMDTDALQKLLTESRHHRLHVAVTFDRERLLVRGMVERI